METDYIEFGEEWKAEINKLPKKAIIDLFQQLGKEKIKLEEVHSDDFTVVMWPEIQELFEEEGFEENSLLINDGYNGPLYNKYSDSAYMVNKQWIKNLK